MARQLPEANLWVLEPERDRLTYPFCVYGYVRAMFDDEKRRDKRADWFFWIEDDIVPPEDLCETLLAAADPEDKPFMAALAYCRTPPYGPGLVTVKNPFRYQWAKAPTSGVHPVDSVGMCACLIHRSLFDRVAEPWFGVLPPTEHLGFGPDAWWCNRLVNSGIQPYVCCDAEVKHIADGVLIGREISEKCAERMAT